MRYRFLLLAVAVVLFAGLLACGVRSMYEAKAPMAREPDQVHAALTPLPEDLPGSLLLAGTDGILLHSGGDVYEVKAGADAYRRFSLPLEGNVICMASAPDGGIWAALQPKDGAIQLVKISPHGALVSQTPLEAEWVQSMVCDSVGHVFLAVDDGQLQRRSPEGELQETAALPEQQLEVCLISSQGRIFAMYRHPSGRGAGTYVEVLGDMSLGAPFRGCTERAELCPVGSFLPGYTVMEHDAAGLYACRADGLWETVCRWSDLHLDGTLSQRFLNNAVGQAVTLYESGGSKYWLTLRAK